MKCEYIENYDWTMTAYENTYEVAKQIKDLIVSIDKNHILSAEYIDPQYSDIFCRYPSSLNNDIYSYMHTNCIGDSYYLMGHIDDDLREEYNEKRIGIDNESKRITRKMMETIKNMKFIHIRNKDNQHGIITIDSVNKKWNSGIIVTRIPGYEFSETDCSVYVKIGYFIKCGHLPSEGIRLHCSNTIPCSFNNAEKFIRWMVQTKTIYDSDKERYFILPFYHKQIL